MFVSMAGPVDFEHALVTSFEQADAVRVLKRA
jgi:hypothetical protein